MVLPPPKKAAPDPFALEVLARLPLAESFYSLWAYLAPDSVLDALFEQHRGRCYQDKLPFAELVGVLADALTRYRGSGRRAITQALQGPRRLRQAGAAALAPGRGLPLRPDRPPAAAVPPRPVPHRTAPEPGRPGRGRPRRQEDQEGRQAAAGHARPAGQALRGQGPGRLLARRGAGRGPGRRPRRRGQRHPPGAAPAAAG